MSEKTIHISGEIGWENTPSEFKDELALLALTKEDTLRVIINSEGGSVFDGFDIYNQLKAIDSKVVTEVRGMAASIASLIMLAGDTIQVSEASTVMIHRAMTMAMGNSEEIEKQVKILDTIDSILIGIYAQKTGKDKETVEDLLSEETWFTGEEAVEAGLADELVHIAEAKYAYAAKLMFNPKKKKMALVDLFKKLRNETSEDASEETVASEGAATEDATEEITNEGDEKAVTREEFDALVSALEQLASAIDALEVEGGEETEEAEEGDSEDAVTEETVDALVENKFMKLVKGLKTSNGQPAKGNNSMTGSPSGWVDKHANFRAKMGEIENKTRNV